MQPNHWFCLAVFVLNVFYSYFSHQSVGKTHRVAPPPWLKIPETDCPSWKHASQVQQRDIKLDNRAKVAPPSHFNWVAQSICCLSSWSGVIGWQSWSITSGLLIDIKHTSHLHLVCVSVWVFMHVCLAATCFLPVNKQWPQCGLLAANLGDCA